MSSMCLIRDYYCCGLPLLVVPWEHLVADNLLLLFIGPNVNLLVPSHSYDMGHLLHSLFVTLGLSLISAGYSRDFGGQMSPRVVAQELSQTLAVTEVPHSRRAVTASCDETPLSLVEAPGSDFGSLTKFLMSITYPMSISEFGHQLPCFNVPHGNEAAIVT